MANTIDLKQTIHPHGDACFLSKFFDKTGDVISISPEQASHFAKHLASDFNTLHNVDAKRFCVPGDLLFALILQQCGLYAHMQFEFNGMVGRNASVIINELSHSADKTLIQIVDEQATDNQAKNYVSALAAGEQTKNPSAIESFVRAYVAFSGQSFPDVLIPLLAEQNVMINPTRPLIMYQSMSLNLNHCDFSNIKLRALSPKLEQDGKRGNVIFPFEFVTFTNNSTSIKKESVIGKGEKSMVLSGLKPYKADKMKALREEYMSWKTNYAL